MTSIVHRELGDAVKSLTEGQNYKATDREREQNTDTHYYFYGISKLTEKG